MGSPLGRCYLYGVVGAGAVRHWSMVGVKGAEVVAIAHGPVAAVVSPLGDARVRSSRADLTAHQRVVEELAEQTTVLPMQFGVVMPDARAVVDELLVENGPDLAAELDRLTGKSEHRLRVTYHEDVAVGEVLAGDRRVQRLQERIRRQGKAAGYGDRIHLGELVAATLEQLKTDDRAAIIDELERHAEATAVLSDQRQDTVVHAAFLVDRSAAKEFDAAVEELAGRSAERMSFELVGPLAPWDFTGSEQPTAGAR
jgi:hypothetical protein